MRVTIFDYGAGNLHSLAKAVLAADAEVTVCADPVRAAETDVLLLPGVGAFAPAAQALAPGLERMRAAIHDGLPCLGICLGMQLLFSDSAEGEGAGLGIFPGHVEKIRAARIPQIGWNTVDNPADTLLERSALSSVYYANSFVCRPRGTECVTAWSTHEADRFPAMVRVGRTVGVQFHPEKSSAPGVQFIREFLKSC